MKKRGAKKKLPFENPLVSSLNARYSLRWFFGTSHFIMGLFAALGVFVVPAYVSNYLEPRVLSFLFLYLIIHLILALDYYFDRNIEEKFLLFFYIK